MDYYPIKLGTGRVLPTKNVAGRQNAGGSASGVSGASGAGSLPNDIKQKVFERDKFTCRCCAFESQKYQQIHYKDHNHSNQSLDNLITTCIFCHQCFNLLDVSEMKSGTLIWMPEISQDHLNNMARAIYVARISQGPVADAARAALDSIMTRRAEAEKRLHTDDPYILATVMQDYLSLKQYYHSSKKLEGLRLFPLDRRLIKEADLEFNQFPQILAYWRSKNGPFGGIPPQKWIELYQDMMARAA